MTFFDEIVDYKVKTNDTQLLICYFLIWGQMTFVVKILEHYFVKSDFGIL